MVLWFCTAATEILATNWHIPTNFTEVDLPDATLKASDFKMKDTDGQNTVTVSPDRISVYTATDM